MTERGVDLLFDGPDNADTVFVLAHGAGAAMDTPFMTAIAEGLAGNGVRVVRFEFPYMQKRRVDGKRRGPDPARVLIATWNELIAELGPDRLVIAGKSMGGRIASMVADEANVRGLVCLGYPFHPPGKPEKTRTAHLESLRTPTLILQGTRDPFGTPDDVGSYALSSAIRLHWIEDGDHSFKPRVKSGRTLEQNLATAVAAIGRFIAELNAQSST
jgi:predicted alpha/beta-hydrolase family hydrolase